MYDKAGESVTRAWVLYERGRTYNNRLTPNQYNLVETNQEFFTGNQWVNLPNTPAMQILPKPMFNILKRVTSLFIASLASTDIAVKFEALAYQDGGVSPDANADAATFASEAVSNLLEKYGFDSLVRKALFRGAITGDYCAHFWFDPDAEPYGGAFGAHTGEIRMELVEGINVMFGNPNERSVEKQPYILLAGRDTVENLRDEAERFRRNRELYKEGNSGKGGDEITSDGETQDMSGIGGKIELDGSADDPNAKALYILLYEKRSEYRTVKDENGEDAYEDELDADGYPVYERDENGVPVTDVNGVPVTRKKPKKRWETTIYVSKMTRNAVIYEGVNTGLKRYPIAWGNWEEQENQYHGRSLITGLIPNQIFINRMFALAFRHMQTMAFQTVVYNADLIPNWNADGGHAIGVHGVLPGQTISQVAYTLPVAEMSGQLMGVIEKAIEYTKECMGATDAQLGNAPAENTSALALLQTNAEVPLENTRALLYEWVRECGHILLDMMGTYYGTRPVVVTQTWQETVTGADGLTIIDQMTGLARTQTVSGKITKEYNFTAFRRLWLNVKAHIGAAGRFAEPNTIQMLENLRKDGTLSVLEYLERIPDYLLPGKDRLIQAVRERTAQGLQTNAAPGAAIPEAGAPVSASALSPELKQAGLPTAAAAAFDAAPNVSKKTLLAQGEMRAT